MTFGGRTTVKLAGAAALESDPIALKVRSGEDFILSITTTADSTDVGGEAGFPAEFAPAGQSDQPVALKIRPLVSLIAARNAPSRCTIVTLGDSITEGARGIEVPWRGWPGRVAARLIARNPAHHCGVVNMGISGNRLLRYGRGTSAIERFGRDVTSVPGVTHVVLLEGINDIARSILPGEDAIKAADLIAGYRRVIALAHAHNLKIIGGTMTPGGGSRHITPALEAVRLETNRWIRNSGEFDAVIDFDAALGNGATPAALKPEYDSGDHLHPGDAGYAAMANAVVLNLFTPAAPSRKASHP